MPKTEKGGEEQSKAPESRRSHPTELQATEQMETKDEIPPMRPKHSCDTILRWPDYYQMEEARLVELLHYRGHFIEDIVSLPHEQKVLLLQQYDATTPFSFLSLPAELRNKVYKELLLGPDPPRDVERHFWSYDHFRGGAAVRELELAGRNGPLQPILSKGDERLDIMRRTNWAGFWPIEGSFYSADGDTFLKHPPRCHPNILLTCRQIYEEANAILYGGNHFCIDLHYHPRLLVHPVNYLNRFTMSPRYWFSLMPRDSYRWRDPDYLVRVYPALLHKVHNVRLAIRLTHVREEDREWRALISFVERMAQTLQGEHIIQELTITVSKDTSVEVPREALRPLFKINGIKKVVVEGDLTPELKQMLREKMMEPGVPQQSQRSQNAFDGKEWRVME